MQKKVCSSEKNYIYIYIRYENLKHIVLNELLSEHDHAELDAQLDEAAWWSTLLEKKTPHLLYIYIHIFNNTNVYKLTYLLHAIVSKDINIIAGSPSKPV